MSWLQWQTEIWPVTEAEAELQLYLWPPDAPCPRQSWSWELFHHPAQLDEKGERVASRWASVHLVELNIQEHSWERVSNREIRADPAWHDFHEITDEYGHHRTSEATLNINEPESSRRAPGEESYASWVAHDFIVRFGARDGYVIPVELEAWMIPEKDYYRLTPESEEEAAAFATGPPNLRVMTPTRFVRCSVMVERCPDPIPRARAYLREAVGMNLPAEVATISWNSYRKLPDGNSEPRPGWSSVVTFDLPQDGG